MARDGRRDTGTPQGPPPPTPALGREQRERFVGAPQPQAEATPRRSGRRRRIWQAVAAVLGVLATAYVVTGILLVGTLVAGVSACMRSCSDAPTQDSRADAAFIQGSEAGERDLVTFDALRGCFQEMYNRQLSSGSPMEQDEGGALATPGKIMDTDEIREHVAAGSWPDLAGTYGEVTSARSPQLWVRLAELCQTRMEEESGERWEVVDLSYPFPDNGPIPWPATRDEGDCVVTRLVCVSGQDEGLYATVSYYRWASPARFECGLSAAREEQAERSMALEMLEGSGLLEQDRACLLKGTQLYLWEQGEGDPLRDPAAFASFASEVAAALGGSVHVTLLAQDVPITLAYSSLGSTYPNSKPSLEMTLAEAQEFLLGCGWAYSLDYPWDGVLLSGYCGEGETLDAESLSGSLG